MPKSSQDKNQSVSVANLSVPIITIIPRISPVGDYFALLVLHPYYSSSPSSSSGAGVGVGDGTWIGQGASGSGMSELPAT